MPLPNTHDVISYVGTITLTVYLFVCREHYPLDEIALAYAFLAGGQAVGNLSVGGQRRLQGGATAPEKIIPPTPAANPVPPA